MSLFNKVTAGFQESRQFLRKSLEEYITFSPEARHLVLKRKTVLLLCQQAESKVEQLKSLTADANEGLIATIEYDKIQVQLHFTPEKITLKEDCIEGELRLLKQPQFETESIVYRYLIAGWKIFLGGKIPNGTLPKEIKIEKNKVYYTLPRNQLQVLDALFHNFENCSILITSMRQGDLTIESPVVMNWSNLKIQNLFQILHIK